MASSAKNIFLNILTSGKPIENEEDGMPAEIVRYILLNASLLIGSIMLVVFGIGVILDGEIFQGAIDLLVAVYAMTGFFILRTRVPYIYPAFLTILSAMALFTFLVADGGIQGFGGLWIYVFPIFTIFALGLRIGLAMCAVQFAAVTAIVFVPGLAAFPYDISAAFRISAVYLMVVLCTIVFEQTRLTKDRVAERLNRIVKVERDEITAMKDNLKVGIFFMNREYIIQGQYSKAMENVMAVTGLQDRSFMELLMASLKQREQDTLMDYFTMVFERSFDNQMLEDINPLHEFSYFSTETGDEKTLRCTFSAVDRENGEVFILGTVQDITHEVALQRQLSEEENKRQEEMKALFEVIQIEPRVFNDFLEDTDFEFNRVNEILRNREVSTRDAVIELYQSIHAVKSNAVILGLENFSTSLHEFESELKELREKDEITFEDILHITVELEAIMKTTDGFKDILARIRSFRTSDRKNQDEYVLLQSLQKVADKASQDLGKKVKLEISHIDLNAIENGPRRVMKEVLTQLVRNAVSHGIESPDERVSCGKKEEGIIQLSIKEKEGTIHIKLKDDGKGLDFSKIRKKAEELNLIKNTDQKQDKNFLLKTIFSPGFSTEGTASMHAGRGIGLNLVRERVRGVNGSIKLQSENGKGTAFNIYIPLERKESDSIAS
ncbi:ATP-binding protein [Breznakiella homolactica]|uniref:histidine kinase n=1 Tax=Breznakiella homolactica TaxID=2798577 RepID=A0A7T8BAT5_9SPIR|nr:ATP-binding protein [Breznakiella homolactica]QQO11074.1 hypothetical protein JFL75_09200 [Breznakiella homolactica]